MLIYHQTEMKDFNNEQIHFTKIYLFLHPFGQPHFLLENKPKPSLQILWYIKVLVKISDISLIISHPLFENILFNSTAPVPRNSQNNFRRTFTTQSGHQPVTASIKSQAPFQEDFHNSVGSLTSQYINKI